jgi:hypothetical protein
LSRFVPRLAAVLSSSEISESVASTLRESHVPAIAGLKNAEERMQPGQTVTVDADDGVVYDGLVSELLDSRRFDTEEAREYFLLRLLARTLSSPDCGGIRRAAVPEKRVNLEQIACLCLRETCRVLLAEGRKRKSEWRRQAIPDSGKFPIPLHRIDLASSAQAEPVASLESFWGALCQARSPKRDASGIASVLRDHWHLDLGIPFCSCLFDVHCGREPGRNYLFAFAEFSKPGEFRSALPEALSSCGFATSQWSEGLMAWKSGLSPDEAKESAERMGRAFADPS